MTPQEWEIKNTILAASYRENHNWAKELNIIKSSKAKKQWLKSREILKELITHQQNKPLC